MSNTITKKIVFIEHQCIGFEHVDFNALWIISVLKSTKNADSILIGEESHNAQVIEKIIENNFSRLPIIFNYKPSWSKIEHKKFFEEYIFLKKIFNNHVDERTQCVVFLSISRTMIIALKYYLKINNINTIVIAIPHAILNEIEGKSSKRFWNNLYKVKRGIKISCPNNLKLIALTMPIYLNVIKYSNKLQWIHIDHPMTISSSNYDAFPNALEISKYQNLTIGVFGSINYDFSRNLSLLKQIKSICPKRIDIKIIGHISLKNTKNIDLDFISYYSNIPISYDEYDKLAKTINLALWLIPPEKTKFVASNTILDIFTYRIPVIYKNNELLKYYSSILGEIGFNYQAESEIFPIIEGILNNNLFDKINLIRHNMKNSSYHFSTETTSQKIAKSIFNL